MLICSVGCLAMRSMPADAPDAVKPTGNLDIILARDPTLTLGAAAENSGPGENLR
jgi:hypothetical protein